MSKGSGGTGVSKGKTAEEEYAEYLAIGYRKNQGDFKKMDTLFKESNKDMELFRGTDTQELNSMSILEENGV